MSYFRQTPSAKLPAETPVDDFAHVIVLPYSTPTKMVYASSPWGLSHHVTPEDALDVLLDAWVLYLRDPKRIPRPPVSKVVELITSEDPATVKARWWRYEHQPTVPPPPKPREVKPWERGMPLGIYFYEHPVE